MTNDAVAVPYRGGTRECSRCGCYSPDGYIIRKGAGSFFVCSDCYQPDVYPLAGRTASLPQKELEALPCRNGRLCFGGGYLLGSPCRNGRLCFGGGYLLGRQEEDGRFIVQKLLPSSCTGPVLYFNPKDMALLSREETEGLQLLGIYRTSPRAVPALNSLDQRNLAALPADDALYGILCGTSETQILLRCKSCEEDLGVILT